MVRCQPPFAKASGGFGLDERLCYSMGHMQRQTAIKILKTIVYGGIYGGLLMPLMFVPVVIFPFVFSKLIFFQILIGLTFPAYAVLAWIEPKYRPRWSYLYLAIGAYFVALLLSVIFAVDPIRAWWGNQERMNGLFTLLHFLMWLTMTTSLIKTWDQWKTLLNYQIILGVFMACVALLQKPFPKLLMFPAGPRVGGLLDNPIYSGAYQLFILFFIALLWFKTKSNGWKTWYVIAFITSLTALFAAGSRGPFMGLIFAMVISAATVGLLHHSKKIRIGIIGAILACAFLYIGIVTVGVKTPAFESFAKSFPTASRIFSLQTGTAGRFIAWDIAWQGFLERPLTGWGLDDFHILFNRKYNPESLRAGYYETWFDRAHNTVMDVFSMTGIVGFVTFLGLWIMLYVTIIKARLKKHIDIPTTAVLMGLPAGYFLQNIFVFDHPAAFSMSYLLYALVICIGFPVFAGKEELQVKDEKPAPTNPVPWVAYGLLQAVFILLIWLTSVMPAYASYLVIKGNTYFGAGNLSEWLNYSKKAAAIQTPYLDEQTFLHSRNLISLADSGRLTQWPEWRAMFDLAREVSDRHLVTHGINAHPRFIYANLLQSVGRAVKDPDIQKQAEDQFLEAIKESPKRQQLFFSYGRLLTEMGRPQEAVEQFRRAVSFDEEIGEAWWYLGISQWYDVRDIENGADSLIKSMRVSRPYIMRGAQDAMMVAQAYGLKGDKDGLKSLIEILPTLPAAPAATYLQIAQIMETHGLMEERNLILGAVVQMDPKSKAQLQPLIDGRATTIEQSLEMSTASATPAVTPPAVTNTVTTTEGEYKGPRR
ncbi:MAG: O-Antigen ligase [Parcubacteria group bacterium ADurb.Bin192]|nr:MAG: O-Antigen ligase [Parcubacteria group bacterium ADurb.Bin192]